MAEYLTIWNTHGHKAFTEQRNNKYFFDITDGFAQTSTRRFIAPPALRTRGLFVSASLCGPNVLLDPFKGAAYDSASALSMRPKIDSPAPG